MRCMSIASKNAAFASLVGQLDAAIALREKLPERDVVGPTIKITTLGLHGRPDEAARTFHQCAVRDIRTWNALLQACARNGHLDDAQCLIQRMPAGDEVTWTTLLATYAQAGHVTQARGLFDAMPSRGVVSWNALIAALAHSGHRVHCQELFNRMPQRSTLAWNSMIAAAIREGRRQEAREMFDRCPQRNIVSWSQMIQAAEDFPGAKLAFDSMPAWDAIATAGMVCSMARGDRSQHYRLPDAFDSLVPGRSAQTWLSFVDAAVQGGRLELAIQCHGRMPCWDTASSNIVITAYTNLQDLLSAEAIFLSIQRKSVISWTSISSANARLGNLARAEDLFDRMSHRNIVAFTVMISSLGHSHRLSDARFLFDQMPERSAITWNAMIAAYAQQGHLAEAERLLHDRPIEDAASRNTMIAAYAQHGSIDKSLALFQSMGTTRDAISWNAMVTALAAAENPAKSLDLVREMDIEGTEIQEPAILAALDAASQIPSLAAARAIHRSIEGTGMEIRPAVVASLISAYGRCGGAAEARGLSARIGDAVAWSCVMDAASRDGAAMDPAVLRAMALEGISPDAIAFSLVVLWCSHRGNVNLGREWWVVMSHDFGVVPGEEQWTCMVDLLARCGCLHEAWQVLCGMPFVPGDTATTVLVSTWNNICFLCK